MTEATGEPAAEVVFSCRQVTKAFPGKGDGELHVLKDITFEVHRGEIAVITGRSGAGKSTLLSVLAGLDRPTSGAIYLEGQRLDLLPDPEVAAMRRRRIGLIFQSFNLLPSWTAYENIEAALLHTRQAPAARREQVMALMDALGIAPFAHHLPSEMSVGQQQRVAVARTLINAPSLILADEPTGDVDPDTAQEILDLLLAPVRRGEATIIVTTHGNFQIDLADTIYVLRDGVLSLRERVQAE